MIVNISASSTHLYKTGRIEASQFVLRYTRINRQFAVYGIQALARRLAVIFFFCFYYLRTESIKPAPQVAVSNAPNTYVISFGGAPLRLLQFPHPTLSEFIVYILLQKLMSGESLSLHLLTHHQKSPGPLHNHLFQRPIGVIKHKNRNQ